MLFRLLGPVEICDERTGLRTHPRSPAQRSLLAALLARPGVPVSAGSLAVEVWGQAARGKAPNALQAHISRLRRTLTEAEPDRRDTRLIGHRDSYVLCIDQAQRDVDEFARTLAQARRLRSSDPKLSTTLLRQGLGLWRGAAAEGCNHGPIVTGLASRLEQARREAIRELAVVDTCSAVPNGVEMASALCEVVNRLDGLAAEQQALRTMLDSLCAVVGDCPGEARAPVVPLVPS